MKTNSKTYLTILGVVVALLLLYTSGSASYSTPKFSYSIKNTSRSITTQFTGRVSVEVLEMLGQ